MTRDAEHLARARRHSRLRSTARHHGLHRDGQACERLNRLAALPRLRDWHNLHQVSDEDLGWLCRVVLRPADLDLIHARAQELAEFTKTRHAS